MSDDILHLRLPDFELQVERLLDSSLRTRPIAIISSHNQNGTIVAASPEALGEGLFPGLKVALARRMTHSVILLPYNSTLYARVHNYLFQTLSRYSPLIEPTVFGQYFADLTGMQKIYGNSLRAGYLLAKDIQSKVSLHGHIGISINKLVSQITTAVVPETIYRVTPGDEATFLAPLATEVLPTASEPSVNKIVRFLLMNQVQDVQQVTEDQETGVIFFGQYFRRVYQEARGQDNTPVRPPQQRDHLTEQTILAEDTNDEEKLLGTVRNLAEQLAYQLRQRRQVTRALTVEIHYTDGFKSQRKGSVTANDDLTIRAEATRLFLAANYRRNRVRALILDATNFQPVINQLDLFRAPKDLRLSQALDRIRQKYGFESIRSASGIMMTRSNSQKTPSGTEKGPIAALNDPGRAATALFLQETSLPSAVRPLQVKYSASPAFSFYPSG